MTKGYELKPVVKCPGCGHLDHLRQSGVCYECDKRRRLNANRKKKKS